MSNELDKTLLELAQTTGRMSAINACMEHMGLKIKDAQAYVEQLPRLLPSPVYAWQMVYRCLLRCITIALATYWEVGNCKISC